MISVEAELYVLYTALCERSRCLTGLRDTVDTGNCEVFGLDSKLEVVVDWWYWSTGALQVCNCKCHSWSQQVLVG